MILIIFNYFLQQQKRKKYQRKRKIRRKRYNFKDLWKFLLVFSRSISIRYVGNLKRGIFYKIYQHIQLLIWSFIENSVINNNWKKFLNYISIGHLVNISYSICQEDEIRYQNQNFFFCLKTNYFLLYSNTYMPIIYYT